MMARLKLRAGVRTDPGLERDHNEDSYFCEPTLGIFGVIDGVGGHNAGELAAEIAAEEVKARLERPEGTIEEALREGIAIANNKIFARAEGRPDLHGMACVLSAAVVEASTVTIGHVGDSRIYKVRLGRIRKLTHDHSPVGEREDRGELTELEAMRHLRRNEVYRDVGTELHGPEDPDFIEVVGEPFEPDAALVLCSDGLSDLVTQGQILEVVLAFAGSPDKTAHELVERALNEGGKDNVTVMVVEGPDFARIRYSPRLDDPEKSSGTAIRRADEPTRRLQGGFAPRDPSSESGGQLIQLPAKPEPGANAPSGASSTLSTPWPGRLPGWVLPLVALTLTTLMIAAYIFWPRTAPITPPAIPAASEPLRWTRVEVNDSEQSQTIHDALARAQRGTVIVVGPGIYHEDELELKSDVILVATQPGKTTIVSQAPKERPIISARNVRNARVMGFELGALSNEREMGILLEDSEVELGELRIVGTTQTAMRITGAATPVLWNVHVLARSGRPLDVLGPGTPTVVGLHEDPKEEPGRTEAGRNEAGRGETGRGEAGRGETGRNEAGRNEAARSPTATQGAAKPGTGKNEPRRPPK